MPRIKSGIKDARKNRAQRKINQQRLSQVKTAMRHARQAASTEAKAVALKTAYQVVDKAVQNRLIHRNAAARYKSRITRQSIKTSAVQA